MRRLEDCSTAYQLESWLANLETRVENSFIDLDNLSKEFIETWFPDGLNPESRSCACVFHHPKGLISFDDMEKLLTEAAEDEDLALDIYTGYGNSVFKDLDEILNAMKVFKDTANRDYFSDTGVFEDNAEYYYSERNASFFLKELTPPMSF